MLSRSTIAVFIVALALLVPRASALAQPGADLARTLECARSAQTEIARWIRLLEEAKATLENRGASARAREDAQASVEVLDARLREAASALIACVPESPGDTRSRVVHVREEVEVGGRREGEAISEHVRASAPRTSGQGGVDARLVHEGLRRLSGSLDACYDALAARHAIERGDATLAFTLTGHEVTGLTLSGLSIRDATFSQCVSRALRGLRVERAPAAGSARVELVLYFGPE